MDTITTYLDSLFASLPDNDKTRQAKADMLANMRDYYRDLLREGKSEEAAIGAVISAFGSIDELRADLGMPAQATATTTQSDPTDAEEQADEDAITETELRSFWHMADQFATQIALGVLLCAVSIALPAYTGGGRWEGFGVIGMFLLAALAVGLFIWGGTVFSQQKKQLNDRPITASAKQLANKTTGEYTRQFAAGLIAGIMICIGSLIPPIISAYIPGFISENAGGALFLAIAGLGSYLIIYVSINYSQLKRYAYATTAANSTAWYHGTDDDAANYWEQPHKHHQNTRARQDIALFHQVYWPTVLIIYLLVSFLLHGWAYSWLIFIIGGVMQNIITAVIARRDYSE